MQPETHKDRLPTWLTDKVVVIMVAVTALLFAIWLLAPARAFAADKGGPELIPQIEEIKAGRPFSGAYLGGIISRPMQTTEIGGLMSITSEDFGYGGKIGYDVRIKDTFLVFGLSASYSRMGLKNAFADTDKSWDVLLRGGFVVGQTTLIFVSGGYTDTDGKLTIPSSIKLPDKGLTLGLGVESYLTKHITASAELLWVDLGSTNGGLLENRMTVPRVGINWRF